MLRVAIVEDLVEDIRRITEVLNRYSAEYAVEFAIDVFRNPVIFLENKVKYGIVFLDIGLPNMSGMEVARRLRKRDTDATLVFATTMAQYAIEGYSVQAFDYILKPISYYGMALKLGRIVSHAQSRTVGSIAIRTDRSSTVRLNYSNIQYIEVQGHNVYWHTTKGEYRTQDTLKSIKEVLPESFFAISRWNVVNMAFVTAIHGDEISVGNDTLKLSRHIAQDFKREYAKYIVGGGRD